MKKLTADFGTQFPGVEIAGTDYGYAGPLSALNNGNVPQPVIDQVQNDLSNWDLPLTTDTPTRIAKTIVTELLDQAGVALLPAQGNRTATQRPNHPTPAPGGNGEPAAGHERQEQTGFGKRRLYYGSRPAA